MKKAEIRDCLMAGKCLIDFLELVPGQECEIFKTERFTLGEDVLYIPDVLLNDLHTSEDISGDMERIEDIIECCYTGNDFLEEADGNAELAEQLFYFCDWQHPSSAAADIELWED